MDQGWPQGPKMIPRRLQMSPKGPQDGPKMASHPVPVALSHGKEGGEQGGNGSYGDNVAVPGPGALAPWKGGRGARGGKRSSSDTGDRTHENSEGSDTSKTLNTVYDITAQGQLSDRPCLTRLDTEHKAHGP